MKWKSYFNTLGLGRRKAAQQAAKNLTQEEEILAYMKQRSSLAFGGSNLAKVFPQMPITSVRRSITQLHKKGKIERMSWAQKSPYGHQEFVYQAK